MSEEQKCVKCGQHREHEEHNNTGTLSGYHIFQLEPLSEKVQAIERMAETHGFEPNTEHPLVCVRCGREHNNYKYHIANSEQVTVPVCEHGCDPKACRFPHEQEVTVPEDHFVGFDKAMGKMVNAMVPEDLRELYEDSDSAIQRELLERLGAAEQQLKEAKSGWDSAIADLRSAAEICREVEAERDRLKEQLARIERQRKIWAEAREPRAKFTQDGKCNCSICQKDFNAFLDEAEDTSMRLAYAEEQKGELRSKVAELEGKVRDMEEVGSQFDTTTTRLHERIEELKTEKAQIRREALEEARTYLGRWDDDAAEAAADAIDHLIESKLPDYDPQPSIDANSRAVRVLRDKL